MPADKLTADQLVAQLAFEAETTKEAARSFLAALDTVTRAARLGRNPGTGETFSLPAKRVVAARLMPSLTLPQD